jgi:FkbM family methyltransferase
MAAIYEFWKRKCVTSVRRRLGLSHPRKNPFAFLDAQQAALGNVHPLDLAAAIDIRKIDRQDFFFIQIGAHDGSGYGDPLTDSIRRHQLRGLLVEPQLEQFRALKAAYADQPQLRFAQAAIAASDGTVPLYKIRPGFWVAHKFPRGLATQISSLNKEQIRKTVALFGGKELSLREDDYLTMETVPALTLKSLLKEYSIAEHIDLLQIDSEGFDYEVLKMVDWRDSPPAMVHYETAHLTEADRIAAWMMLRGIGYNLYATNIYNTLAIKRGSAAG